LNNL